ncbi:MAG: M1 family peptidase, partial [Sphingobacterium sp.]
MIRQNIYSCGLALLLLTGFAQAQELYTPRNIKQAIEKGTRTTTGVPGKNYWQNFGKYDVKVQLDPSTKTIRGNETILYSNNSLDTLKQLAIRFVNNVHKPNAARANYASDDYLTSGLKIKSFKLNGQVYEVNSKDWGTVKLGDFGQKILPGTVATLEISWEYPLSVDSDRDGMLNASTFYCAYSYPRVSVYDDYNGWDVLEHNGRQEFYNGFNDY